MAVAGKGTDKSIKVERLERAIGPPILHGIPRLGATQQERCAAGILEVIRRPGDN